MKEITVEVDDIVFRCLSEEATLRGCDIGAVVEDFVGLYNQPGVEI
jgi:hypothetical protein